MNKIQNLKTLGITVLFFTTVFILSYFLTEPRIEKQTNEEKNQSVKDSLLDEQYKKELETYPFDHSKIPTNGK